MPSGYRVLNVTKCVPIKLKQLCDYTLLTIARSGHTAAGNTWVPRSGRTAAGNATIDGGGLTATVNTGHAGPGLLPGSGHAAISASDLFLTYFSIR